VTGAAVAGAGVPGAAVTGAAVPGAAVTGAAVTGAAVAPQVGLATFAAQEPPPWSRALALAASSSKTDGLVT